MTGHPSQELQVSSTSFFSPSYFLCNPVFVVFDEILLLQNAIFTLNVYNGQSQSVPGAFTLFFLRMLKWWLALYCRGYQQCLTYHSSGQTKVLWQHPTIGWKVNNYILHHIYVLVMPISQKTCTTHRNINVCNPPSSPSPPTPGLLSSGLAENPYFCRLQRFFILKILMKSFSLWRYWWKVSYCEDINEKFVIVIILI